MAAVVVDMREVGPRFICWARGFLELGAVSGRAGLAEMLRQYCSAEGTLPLLLFPEEDTTNGRGGLLKFSSWPFTVTDAVQPVAVTARRPLLTVSTAESSWLTELFWTLFIPFTVYQVRWLPSMCRQEGDLPQDFGDRVQKVIAGELGLAPTRVTRADKVEHIKRKRHVLPRTRDSNAAAGRTQDQARVLLVGRTGPEDARVTGMAQQVKEVLPDVPLTVIMRDLVLTNCVDTTITNLLEGSGDVMTEDSVEAAMGEAAPSMATPTHAPWPVAQTFEKSPVDRHMSLQERKEALYEYARRRYIEKHGLKDSVP